MIPPNPPLSGLFLFDKPKGITSHDAVDLLRLKLSFRRIGHTGTLDPMATGLLILLAGSATSAQERMQGSAKIYSGTILFGAETDTWDAEGKTVFEAPPPDLGAENLDKAVAAFNGKFTQLVPPYSAVRLKGKPMHMLARWNLAMPDVRRDVQVRWISWTARPPALDFEIECSGGTYIRSIACELGRAMGSRAHLSVLRRVSIGDWNVRDAVNSEDLKGMSREAALAKLRPAPEN